MNPILVHLESRSRAAVATTALVLALAAALFLTVSSAQAASKCTPAQGQQLIDTGRYRDAIREFSCVIASDPTGVEGYRGRIEAELLLGRFADAAADHARITAVVLPVHPDAHTTILDGYKARLAASPDDIPALTGASFANWWFFDYPSAMHLLDRLLDLRPNDLYGTLLRGSNRLLHHSERAAGAADLERAIALAPQSPDVRWIVADAYTYGQPDPERAIAEATLALDWGLDTPRVHAILASSYLALGNLPVAAAEFEKHIDLVTTELLPAPSLAPGGSLSLGLVANRTYAIPVPATAGQTISIATGSGDFYDSILVLLAPDGTPVVGSDDYVKYFAGFQWVAPATGTYKLLVTSFEGVSTGDLTVTRG